MKTSLKVIACMAALAVLMVVQSASAQGKLEGVWKQVEFSATAPKAYAVTNPQPGYIIFAKKHYCTVAVTSEKPRPVLSLEKATDAQKVAAWTDFEAYAGTYEVKGTTVTFHDEIAKSPEGMKPGSFGSFDFKIEGNTLTLMMKADEAGPATNGFKVKLVRIE